MAELIHTCYRVADLDRSIAFYEKLGMEEVGRIPIRDEAINVFMGLPGDGPRLELTYNVGHDEPYEIGTGYGHIAITMGDMDAALERLAGSGSSRSVRLHRRRGRPAPLLRSRSGRLPGRADRVGRHLIQAWPNRPEIQCGNRLPGLWEGSRTLRATASRKP